MQGTLSSERIRVRGLVQGVGFRPTVWRLAQDCGLAGDVCNDGAGVLIRVQGDAAAIERFCTRLRAECPPLARIDTVERQPGVMLDLAGFSIAASASGEVRTGVVPDAATCPACLAEISDPAERRYRYPFANCTHCGPRLSIVRAIPYDRGNTSMAEFALCADCAAEYADPSDRRFHAQPIACPACGPKAWLEDDAGQAIDSPERDAVAAASSMLRRGLILAIKGIGGFHLACDASDPVAVARLRERKRRLRKPFALMARDTGVIRRYCRLDPAEEELLAAPAAPILLLEVADASGQAPGLAPDLAPGQDTLGFMLPYSPLHHLLLEDWDTPLVMTSGNLSEEPQCIGNDDARQRLRGLADAWLLHDRAIVNRVDDSVVRLMRGRPRLLRRARGYAPAPLPLAPGLEAAPPLLALGGELKSTLCLLQGGQAILSQHLGDLEDARTAEEFEATVGLYRALYRHEPQQVVVDLHPDYRSTRFGEALAVREGCDILRVQHHFAHVASVLADNARPADAGPVIGIALDGLGLGEDGTIWGGEFLLADYRGYRRVAHLAPAPLPGGVRAMLEPWRNTYAHIVTHLGRAAFERDYPGLELAGWLRGRPLDLLDRMLETGLNSPVSSSCGRLFDAVAGALGLARAGIGYEGEAAIALEVLARRATDPGQGYPFAVDDGAEPWRLDPAPMWRALFDDLAAGVAPERVAARFHAGLAAAVAGLGERLARRHGVGSVALSGGVLQNRTLFEALAQRLEAAGLEVLAHQRVPANDGGLALGQAAIAAARALAPAGEGR